jgi:hypothetical protein
VPFWKLSLESFPLMRWIERELIGWGKCEQGFRRMAARSKPAGIRSLVYGMGKGKVRIEGLSVFQGRTGWLSLDQAERDRFFGGFLAIAD